MFYQVIDNRGKIYAETFTREEALGVAKELAAKKIYPRIQRTNGQTAAIEQASHQCLTGMAFDSFKTTMREAQQKKNMRPVVIQRGEHKYTVPVAMLNKDGSLKASVTKLVNAYFDAVSKKEAVTC